MEIKTAKTAKEWIEEGDKLYDVQKYEEGIICYDKALELDPQNDLTWNSKGNALRSLGRYEDAITCYDKAIELNPKNDALLFKGILLNHLERYKEAIVCLDKAIELNPQDCWAWSTKSDALRALDRNEEAIACYDNVLGLNPLDDEAWCLKGSALNSLERYNETITCYEEALDLNPQNVWAWNAKGYAFISLGHYDEAITCFDKAYELNSEPDGGWGNAASVSLYKQISNRLSLEKTGKEIYYKCIFILSRSILNRLHARDEAEQGVAHYTTPKMLNVLILDDLPLSKLRLHLINLSNDCSEGRTLMDYLYGKYIPIEDNGIIALSASFTFNQDCLNQFRLYGKDDNREKEGAGVSIIVKNTFFESTSKAPSDRMIRLNAEITMIRDPGTEETLEDPYQDQKETLYRCMYVDPETQQVIALGQREEYTFYRDRLKGNEDDETKKRIKESVGKTIEGYRTKMNVLVKRVQKTMDEILKIVKENELDFNIVAELLVDLRCLTKHVAFREEQECRIVKVTDYTTDKRVKHSKDYHQLYMEYLPLVTDRDKGAHHVKAVCFGPHFKYREVYAAELRKIGIPSRQSKHPLA
ncbi:MAG: tetratricopeptide repeat protein [Prevotellaceae bacterium]|jgi:tetratricopeptide (TPR) repeat protein|nr:tetratricopeptide repeat protein [Prevotellaceae bacterium]